MEQIIAQGAEAILIKKSPFLLIKRRIKKSYRLPALDEKIRRQRTKREFNLLEKASRIIHIPKILKIGDNEIEMEFIEGKRLSENLELMGNKFEICREIGKNIARLHDAGIIHGDLTTSNIILSDKDNFLYFIDFGLGFFSNKIEDKAVELHLIKQALEAKHFRIAEECFKEILAGYTASANFQQVIERLKKVESRGRYKERF